MKYAFLLFCMVLLIAGCVDKTEKIDLNIVQEPKTIMNDSSVKVAIASVVSPKESYEYYEDMIRYISRSLGGNVKIIQRRSYQEINDLIKKNEIDFAFVCGGAYIDGNSKFGMKILVAPVINGNTTYRSYIIVRNNSNYTNLSDLRDKKFAFSDPLSNSGKLYPTYRLYLMNETPGSFFDVDEQGKNNSFFTYSHDNSIIAVAEKIADGAAVDSLVYDYMKETNPEIIAKTRIIEISPPFGIPPIVVSKDINPFLEEKLRNIFLNMDKDEEGREVLARVKIEKFVNLGNNAYDSIREMRKRVQ
ncbi:MAG: phosphate/phosphite/phosphonate ABC transporter substrate-binding protein [Candidatus Methanoperedens sp.]|nr:phosphate/phosphite/phosphonate ABC transporter substrate-binding protein [Candidatus Methanoperedens sp.]